jgi:DNA recombination protein RmuC
LRGSRGVEPTRLRQWLLPRYAYVSSNSDPSIGLAIGIALGFVIATLKSRAANASSVGAQAQVKMLTEQLAAAQTQQNNNVRLDEVLSDVKARMNTLTTQAQEAENKRFAAESAIKTQIESMRVGNQSLLEQATKLAGALSNSQTRGKFGETQLEILLESAGLIEGVHFERQESSRSDSADISRPDITIAIPGGSQIFIDSKFPFHRFLEAVDMEDPDARQDAMALHAKDLLKHVDALAKRDYQGVSNSPDFVVLFAPFESILSESLKADPQLLEKAFSKHVTIATPTTMLALLRTVGYAFSRNDLARNATEIQNLAGELLKRIGSLHSKHSTLGDRIKSAERAYNDVIATAETTVMRPARKMIQLGVSSGSNKIGALPDVDDEVRAIKSAALEIDYIDAEEDEEEV